MSSLRPYLILTIGDEVENFVESKLEEDAAETIVVHVHDTSGNVIEYPIEEFLGEFAVELLHSFVNGIESEDILNEELPQNNIKNLQKRKGAKFVLDHLKAIIHEVEMGNPWI